MRKEEEKSTEMRYMQKRTADKVYDKIREAVFKSCVRKTRDLNKNIYISEKL